MSGNRYRGLLGAEGELDALAFVRAMELSPTCEDRPLVLANFVSSLDGHTTVRRRSRALSGSADRELFYALREHVDAVLVGPRTLADECYKRMLPAAERRERRLSAGLPAEPLLVTLTRTGELPLSIPLFAEPEARVLVFTQRPPLAARSAASVVHAPLSTLAELLATLRREHGVDTLLCEGGPTLLGGLLREALVDELFLTLAPVIAGGASGPSLLSGPPPAAPLSARLVSALERDATVFTRYSLR